MLSNNQFVRNSPIFSAHWRHAHQILKTYQGQEPLSLFLKNYYQRYPQCGSKDRKKINALVYAFYRFRSSTLHLDTTTTIALSLALSKPSPFYIPLPEQYQALYNMLREEQTFEQQLNIITHFFNISAHSLLKGHADLSPHIDPIAYLKSLFLTQYFYIQIIQQKTSILHILHTHNITFKALDNNIYQLPHQQNVASHLNPLKGHFLLQDYSCLHVFDGILFDNALNVWDCCCGSGGKTLIVKSQYPHLRMWHSDNRPSVLHTLQERLNVYGWASEGTACIDLSVHDVVPFPLMDVIIADVPCSGSGTWHSVPEQMYFFDTARIAHWSALQQRIVHNVLPRLKPGGRLVYITCSVFSQENEQQIDYFVQQYQLTLVFMKTIAGYQCGADTLFVAVLQKAETFY